MNTKLIVGLIILAVMFYWFRPPSASLLMSMGGGSCPANSPSGSDMSYYCTPVKLCVGSIVAGSNNFPYCTVASDVTLLYDNAQIPTVIGGDCTYSSISAQSVQTIVKNTCAPVIEPPIAEPPQPINLLDYIITAIRNWLKSFFATLGISW